MGTDDRYKDEQRVKRIYLSISHRTWPGRSVTLSSSSPRVRRSETSTEPALLSAPDFRGLDGGDSRAEALWASDAAAKAGEGEPSLGLTVAIACDDVYATWLFVLGEALQELQHTLLAARRDAAKLVLQFYIHAHISQGLSP